MTTNIHSKLLAIIGMILLLASCQELLIGDDEESIEALDNFDYLWKECDEKYSFFNTKNIDWDSVEMEYRPRITQGMSDDSLFAVLAAMLNELKDGHVNLISDFNVSFYPFVLDRQDNFDFRIIQEHYLPRDFHRTASLTHDFIADGEVGYIRLGAFSGAIGNDDLDLVLRRYEDTNGIVFDIRENGGGSIAELYRIVRRFVPVTKAIFKNRIKSGPGHDDFSEIEDVILEPSSHYNYDGNVILLVDRGTYSAGSFFTLMAKAIDKITIIGDDTGGGLGLPNGGQLPNGWTYRFSVSQALDLDENNYENGVPPDMYINMDWTDLTTDEILEEAIELLSN